MLTTTTTCELLDRLGPGDCSGRRSLSLGRLVAAFELLVRLDRVKERLRIESAENLWGVGAGPYFSVFFNDLSSGSVD